jgi:hypothetical protein
MSDEAEIGRGMVQPLLAAVQRLLRPLVRLLVHFGVPYPTVSELLRWIYVDVAVRDFPLAGKPQTDSRISLLTGVHRREVRRLRRKADRQLVVPRSATLGTQIIARWLTHSDYVEKDGSPRNLPYMSGDARSPSFENLVRTVSKDIRPRVVLDEWLRLGVVALQEAEVVHLVTDAFVPVKGAEELAYFFGRNLHDHLAAGAWNLMAGEPSFLERSVYYNNLSESSVAELEAFARERGVRLLREVNARALQMQRRDSPRPGPKRRMNFGLYFFSEDTSRASETEREDGDG